MEKEKKDFVLKYGVLGWGISMWLAMSVWEGLRKPGTGIFDFGPFKVKVFCSSLLENLPFCLLGGFLFGLYAWRFIKRRKTITNGFKYRDNIYEITVSDPFDYSGPNPIAASGVGVVHGPQIPSWQESDWMLEVIEPFFINNEKVEYLLVSPRHEGVSINDLQRGEHSVGIGKVEPGHKVYGDRRYTGDDVKYWAIGSIRPRSERTFTVE